MSDYERIIHPDLEVIATPRARDRNSYPYAAYSPRNATHTDNNDTPVFDGLPAFIPWDSVFFPSVNSDLGNNLYSYPDNDLLGLPLHGVRLAKAGVYWVSVNIMLYVDIGGVTSIFKTFVIDLTGPGGLADRASLSHGGTVSSDGLAIVNNGFENPYNWPILSAYGFAFVTDPNDDANRVYTVVTQRSDPGFVGANTNKYVSEFYSRMEVVYLGRMDQEDRVRAFISG